tara:strand:+ start:211 stop:669 length:459 start_codon:yes stop_codon:yes gene_type:complete
MKQIKIKFLVLLFFLTSCGFSPIYDAKKNTDFNIQVTELLGDRDMNNLIKSNLKKYSDSSKAKLFKVKINSTINKRSLAKDTTGKTTDYRIEVTYNFKIDNEKLSKKINITETFDYKNIEDVIEFIKYENIVKQNIANIASQKLISQIIRIE